ncbi:MAG: leucine-rich repeat domain-containing protein [Candidatus Amoebophilus sp.]
MRKLNLYFHEFITGYNQVGMVGVENKPDRAITKSAWSLKHAINFNKLKDKLATMHSFIFYQLMRKVDDLPQAYWPYLADTQIHAVYLWRNKIGPIEVEMLGKCLQRSRVHTVYLGWNQIGDIGAEAFGKTLAENRHIREVNLSKNKLGAVGAKGVTEHFPRTMRIINLWNNEIGDEGAIIATKNVRGKEVEEINLGDNKIGDKGAIEMIENLESTSVERLSLGNNKITDEGAIGAAKNIRGTNLEELSLGYNQITNKGAVKVVEHCRGTKMKKLNLSFNRGITDEVAA